MPDIPAPPRRRLPPWIRTTLRTDPAFQAVSGLVNGLGLHTVCEDAQCPNRHECWNRGTATVMILGEICTRACRFCSVRTGRPEPVDGDEPRRVAEAVQGMNLKHVVITSVDRDDLKDGGAGVWADTIRAVRTANPEVTIEVLTPDFGGDETAVQTVLDAAPDIFSHNLETIRRLQPAIRPQANYGRSLGVLQQAAGTGTAIKSGMMLGLGESEEDVHEAFGDLHAVGCRILALGQYLQPTRRHAPVHRYVEPAEFERLDARAREIGFSAVAAGPMVRSSYRAEELLAEYHDHIG